MRTRHAVAVGLIALVAAIVWFVRHDPDERARGTATAAAKAPPVTRQPSSRRRPPVRLTMPPPAIADVVVPPACANGVGGTEQWWACLPRDPAWDAERTRYLLDRVSRHVGLALDVSRLECRVRCCRLRLTQEEYRIYNRDLSSSVGVRVGPTDGYLRTPIDPTLPDGDLLITTCWKPGSLEDYPDRAVEREIVLAEAAKELAACGTLPGAPTEARLSVALGDEGGIDAISHETSMPRPVMQCISEALRNVGVFEPPPSAMARTIPMRVRLRI